MSIRSFFLGDINKTDAWTLTTEDEEPNNGSVLQDLSNELESRTGVSLHQCSHTARHGILGLFGYVDQQQQNVDSAWEAFQEGRLTESEFGYAVGAYHDAENHKSGLRYLLGF